MRNFFKKAIVTLMVPPPKSEGDAQVVERQRVIQHPRKLLYGSFLTRFRFPRKNERAFIPIDPLARDSFVVGKKIYDMFDGTLGAIKEDDAIISETEVRDPRAGTGFKTGRGVGSEKVV